MVSVLYLIRHGETSLSGAKKYIGSLDLPLSEKGLLQMKNTSVFIAAHLDGLEDSIRSGYLADIHSPAEIASEGAPLDEARKREKGPSAAPRRGQLAAVYCSDLSRALKSAEIVAEPHGIRPIISRELRERSFGIWEGMSFLEIKDKYPDEFTSWAKDPVRFSPMGGESTIAVAGRVIPEFELIMERHAGEKIAIVAHGGINRIILCQTLGIPLENIFRIEQDCGAINLLEFWESYPVLKLMNFRP